MLLFMEGRELREELRAIAAKVETIAANMVRRDELSRVESMVTGFVPRTELESRWQEQARRHDSLEHAVDGMKRGRFDERLLTLENVAIPRAQVEIATLDKATAATATLATTVKEIVDKVAALEKRVPDPKWMDAIDAQLKEIRENRLPKWTVPSLSIIVPVAVFFLAHFWK